MASLTSVVPAEAFGSSTPPPGPPSVSAGGYITCGVRADVATPSQHRTAACWGDNVAEGGAPATPPAGVMFSEINSGYSHSCGVRHDPGTPAMDLTAVCWGSNASFASTPPSGMKFTHIAPGFEFTCGLRQDTATPANDKTAVCWGANDASQVTGTPGGVKFTQLAVGVRHVCGLRETPVNGNNILCWGSNTYGQVTNVPSGTFAAVTSGNFDICVLSSGGAPQCWGRNAGNQSLPPLGETFIQISAGFQHVCGLRANGSVACWGRNTEGQALPPSGIFNNVSAGTFHSCGMTTGGNALCWGDNAEGRARPEMTSLPPVPTATVGQGYSHQFTSTYMSPRSWSVTGILPPGLLLNAASGRLSGTPSQAGVFSDITVSASNGLAKASETFSIVVSEGAPNPLPTVSVGDVSVHEGANDTRAATFTVSLSKPSSTTVTVDYATADDTASAPADYEAKSGTLSFSPGATSANVKVRVAGDTADEPDERFTLNLTEPVEASVGDANGTGTIIDDDPGTGRRLDIGDVAVHEGDEGARTAVFNVTLSKPATSYVTVNYATAKGTASKSSDFVGTSGTLRFAPGVHQLSVKVTVNPDTSIEGDESFAVNLSGASGATVTDGNGIGTVVDDD